MTTDFEVHRQRVALLNKARVLINEEYMKKRLAAQEKWRTDSHHMWITQGILLPYPVMPDMPTEQDIVNKAMELYNDLPERQQEQKEQKEPLPPNVKPIHGPVPVDPDKPITEPVEPITPDSEPVPELSLSQLSEKERQNTKLRALLAQFVTTAKTLDSESRREVQSDSQ